MIEIREESVIRAILRDQTFLPIDVAGVLAAVGTGMNRDFTKLLSRVPTIPFFATGLRHRDLRKVLNGFFRPDRLELWRPIVRSRAQAVAAGISGKTNVCLVEDFSLPLSLGFMSDLLGLRHLEYASARDLLRDLEVLVEPLPSISLVTKAQLSLEILCKHILEGSPDEHNGSLETLYGHLFKHVNEHGTLTHDDVGTLVAICFIGTSVTANTFHNILHFLLKSTDSLRPTGQRAWVERHLEELMRMNAPVTLVVRRATADRMIGSYELHAGDLVALIIAQASQDFNGCPADKPSPSSNRSHLVFGAGAHTCPGSYIARVMLEEALVAAGRGLSSAVLVEPATLVRRQQTNSVVNLFVDIPLNS